MKSRESYVGDDTAACLTEDEDCSAALDRCRCWVWRRNRGDEDVASPCDNSCIRPQAVSSIQQLLVKN